jgi:RNA polymerase sigma factor (sigma-70 family)
MVDRIRVSLIKEGCYNIFDRLVYSIAWTHKRQKDEIGWMDVHELAAVGMAKIKEVFLKDPGYYKPEEGAALSTVIHRIAGNAMIDFLRQEARIYKATNAYHEHIAMSEKTVEEIKQIMDTQDDIEQAIAELENDKRPYRDVINEFYGFGFHYKRSKKELADKHGVTRQTISNWIKKGVEMLNDIKLRNCDTSKYTGKDRRKYR